jgi:hypothetical protein
MATDFSAFASSEHYRRFIEVLTAAGLSQGDVLLDFGASWGYGSWYLRQSGFNVYSYEISRPRAEFARKMLSCEIVESIDDLPCRVRCFFSAHVIEHLPNPSLIWEVADNILTDDGFIACFCPNGEPARESVVGPRPYDQAWGKVHPMLVTPKFLRTRSRRFGFDAYVCSSPYAIDDILNNRPPVVTTGDELCLIARRA